MGFGSRHTNFGNSFFDTRTVGSLWKNAPHPLLIPPTDGYGYFEDFFRWSEDEWTVTAVSAGSGVSTIALTDGDGGLVRVDTDTDENDGAQAQLDAASFKLPSTSKFWFECRLSLTDEATQSDAVVYLADTSTTLIASPPNDLIGFRKDDGDTNWDFTAEKNGTASNSTGIATASTSFVQLGFYYNGSTATPWVNGVESTANAISTNIPDDIDLHLSFGYLNGAAAAQNEGMNLDWVRIVSIVDRG